VRESSPAWPLASLPVVGMIIACCSHCRAALACTPERQRTGRVFARRDVPAGCGAGSHALVLVMACTCAHGLQEPREKRSLFSGGILLLVGGLRF